MRSLWQVGMLTVLLGCGSLALQRPPVAHTHGDQRPLPAVPHTRTPSLANDIVEMSFAYQVEQFFDAPRLWRKWSGRPYEALNVDRFDEVPNSSWFTNRNQVAPLSLEAVRQGASLTGGPDTTAPWQVVSLKSAGVTPGMTVIDGRGDRYIVKFDPPDFPELPSAAEVVVSRLFHAAGYNVPENYIAYLSPNILEPAPGAKFSIGTSDKRSSLTERALSRDDLEAMLRKANPMGAPRVRVLASRFLPGRPVGPWSYRSTRSDDYNDVYPHEHRRDLRGLYVICSWLNHADMKEENTLDMYDPERRRVLTHYLIDSGAAMGSNSTHPSGPRRGRANSFDLKESLTRLLTLGLYVRDYERAPRTVDYPAAGYLGNEVFKPESWKPMYPMPAFEEMTRRDAFWGTRITTSFSDAQIAAAVSAGEYSDPAAAAAVAAFLRERRDRIGRYWFARLNSLDRFAIEDEALVFADLALDRGYATDTVYDFAVWTEEGKELTSGVLKEGRLPLEEGVGESEGGSQSRSRLGVLGLPSRWWSLSGRMRVSSASWVCGAWTRVVTKVSLPPAIIRIESSKEILTVICHTNLARTDSLYSYQSKPQSPCLPRALRTQRRIPSLGHN
jgi:hypothetical protein